MVQTHFDLIDIVRNDLTLLGFPNTVCQSLDDHESAYKNHDCKAASWLDGLKDASWFNAAANYLAATERVLQCKLKACSDVLVDASITDLALRESAVKILLDPGDGLALQHGISFIVKQELLEQYNSQLLEVCKSPLLHKLSLDLKGAGLTGTMRVSIDLITAFITHALLSIHDLVQARCLLYCSTSVLRQNSLISRGMTSISRTRLSAGAVISASL
jgi:hypothetical protein